MKRGFIALFLLVLLVSPLILAAENTSNGTEDVSALRGGIDDKTEDVLSKEIAIPNFLKTPFKIMFGIESPTSWQRLIVVFGVLIGFFIIMLDILDITPFFEGETIKILASAAITLLISVTGALDMAAKFFFDIAGFFDFANSWAPLKIIIAIILAVAMVFIVKTVIHQLKDKLKIEKAHMGGQKIHEAIKDTKASSKTKNI